MAKIRKASTALPLIAAMKDNLQHVDVDGNLTPEGAIYLNSKLAIALLVELDAKPYVYNGRYLIRQLRNKYGFSFNKHTATAGLTVS